MNISPLINFRHAGTVVPDQLLDGGHHFDDIGERGRRIRWRRYNSLSTQSRVPLPRERMHELVCDAGLTRPVITQAGQR